MKHLFLLWLILLSQVAVAAPEYGIALGGSVGKAAAEDGAGFFDFYQVKEKTTYDPVAQATLKWVVSEKLRFRTGLTYSIRTVEFDATFNLIVSVKSHFKSRVESLGIPLNLEYHTSRDYWLYGGMIVERVISGKCSWKTEGNNTDTSFSCSDRKSTLFTLNIGAMWYFDQQKKWFGDVSLQTILGDIYDDVGFTSAQALLGYAF